MESTDAVKMAAAVLKDAGIITQSYHHHLTLRTADIDTAKGLLRAGGLTVTEYDGRLYIEAELDALYMEMGHIVMDNNNFKNGVFKPTQRAKDIKKRVKQIQAGN